jgi:hypothetical protein
LLREMGGQERDLGDVAIGSLTSASAMQLLVRRTGEAGAKDGFASALATNKAKPHLWLSCRVPEVNAHRFDRMNAFNIRWTLRLPAFQVCLLGITACSSHAFGRLTAPVRDQVWMNLAKLYTCSHLKALNETPDSDDRLTRTAKLRLMPKTRAIAGIYT